MPNPNAQVAPATCGCSADTECPQHRWANNLVHHDQTWDAYPGHPGIDPADDTLDLP